MDGVGGDAYAQFLSKNAHRIVEEDDCLLWMGACAGKARHPSINRQLVRRLLWELERGPVPTGKVLRCTCETPRCINLAHVECMTMQQLTKQLGARGGIMSDPLRSAKIAATHRARHPLTKLSQDQVREIRASDEPGTVLAKRYGVCEGTISKVRLVRHRREFAGNPWQGLGA